MQTAKGKRIVSMLTAMAVCFVMLFSACFIAAEAHHDCAGEGCTVCAQIISCENVLRNVTAAVSCVFLVLHIFTAAAAEAGAAYTARYNDTLIELKVELLN